LSESRITRITGLHEKYRKHPIPASIERGKFPFLEGVAGEA